MTQTLFKKIPFLFIRHQFHPASIGSFYSEWKSFIYQTSQSGYEQLIIIRLHLNVASDECKLYNKKTEDICLHACRCFIEICTAEAGIFAVPTPYHDVYISKIDPPADRRTIFITLSFCICRQRWLGWKLHLGSVCTAQDWWQLAQHGTFST